MEPELELPFSQPANKTHTANLYPPTDVKPKSACDLDVFVYQTVTEANLRARTESIGGMSGPRSPRSQGFNTSTKTTTVDYKNARYEKAIGECGCDTPDEEQLSNAVEIKKAIEEAQTDGLDNTTLRQFWKNNSNDVHVRVTIHSVIDFAELGYGRIDTILAMLAFVLNGLMMCLHCPRQPLRIGFPLRFLTAPSDIT
jgi:hypothetical protein